MTNQDSTTGERAETCDVCGKPILPGQARATVNGPDIGMDYHGLTDVHDDCVAPLDAVVTETAEAYNARLDPFMELAQSIHDEAYTNGFADAKYDGAGEEYDRDVLIETLDGECRRDSWYEGLEHDSRSKFEALIPAPSRMAASSDHFGGVNNMVMAASSEGWVLVPSEPTPEMEIAGRQSVNNAIGEHHAAKIYAAMLAARPDIGREVDGLDWETIADERGKIAADLGARLVLARMAIENAVDTLRNRGRFGSPDDALANLSDTLAALRSGSTPPIAVPVSEEMVEAAARGLLFRAKGTASKYHDEVWRDHPDNDRHWDHDGVDYCESGRNYYREIARAALTAALAVPDKGVRGDQGSSGGLGQPGSGSQPEANVGATAALAGAPETCTHLSDALPSEDEIAQILSSIQRGAMRLRDAAVAIMNLYEAAKPSAWRYEFGVPRQEDGWRDGSLILRIAYGPDRPTFEVRNLTPLYERRVTSA